MSEIVGVSNPFTLESIYGQTFLNLQNLGNKITKIVPLINIPVNTYVNRNVIYVGLIRGIVNDIKIQSSFQTEYNPIKGSNSTMDFYTKPSGIYYNSISDSEIIIYEPVLITQTSFSRIININNLGYLKFTGYQITFE